MLSPTSQPKLHRDESGVAFMEFAFGFPIILFLIMAGLELTNLALVHTRLSHIAETAADNSARVRSQMDENDIAEIFSGTEVVGRAVDFVPKGRVVLSSLQDNGLSGSNRGQWIRWQRCSGNYNIAPQYGREGDGQTNSSMSTGMGATGRKIAAVPGTAVMFVEVYYWYAPMIFQGFVSPREIRYQSAFNVRERNELGITNVRGLAVRRC